MVCRSALLCLLAHFSPEGLQKCAPLLSGCLGQCRNCTCDGGNSPHCADACCQWQGQLQNTAGGLQVPDIVSGGSASTRIPFLRKAKPKITWRGAVGGRGSALLVVQGDTRADQEATALRCVPTARCHPRASKFRWLCWANISELSPSGSNSSGARSSCNSVSVAAANPNASAASRLWASRKWREMVSDAPLADLRTRDVLDCRHYTPITCLLHEAIVARAASDGAAILDERRSPGLATFAAETAPMCAQAAAPAAAAPAAKATPRQQRMRKMWQAVVAEEAEGSPPVCNAVAGAGGSSGPLVTDGTPSVTVRLP